MQAVISIFEAENVPLDYQYVDMGKQVYLGGDSSGMTEEARKTVEKNGILFKGPMETPKGRGVKSINVTARKVWNTFANRRVFRTLKGVNTIHSNAGIPIELTIIRENIEDTYGGIEHMLTHDVALCRRFITRPGSEQVHRYAFEVAKARGVKQVTCGHKANIMKITDGLFLETFYEVAKDYPEIKANDKIIDDLAMKLVSIPDQFGIIVLPNLQGDIISDLCAGLVGGLGFAPSANVGNNISIFEAVHGTAPDIAGKNIANPTSLLLSGIMMLQHVGLDRSAARIQAALNKTLEDGIHTGDFGDGNTPPVNTTEFANAIIENLKHVSGYEETKNQIDFTPPPNLQEQRMMESPRTGEETIHGLDFFTDNNMNNQKLAEILQNEVDTDKLKLTMISNRGTQVWPSWSNYTECINQPRIRYEDTTGKGVTQQDILEVAARMAKVNRICSMELLLKIDGKPMFSLAQGQ